MHIHKCLVLASGTLECRIYRRQKARERLSSWMHSVRDVIHTDTHDFYYIAEKEKKEKKHIERLKRGIHARSNYTINVLDGPCGDVKIRKVYVVWNLRSLRLLCRRTILYVLIGYLSIINWIVYQFLRLLVKEWGGSSNGCSVARSRCCKVKFLGNVSDSPF